MSRRDEPFIRMVSRIQEDRREAARTLCNGQWETLSDAQRLVGKYLALTGVLEEMRTIAGPGTEFGEEDL